jgi:hypothetical protein
MITNELNTKIVIFDDGKYFAGIKSKMVTKTKHFKDAKIMNELSERDINYLKYKNDWRIVEVRYTFEIK